MSWGRRNLLGGYLRILSGDRRRGTSRGFRQASGKSAGRACSGRAKVFCFTPLFCFAFRTLIGNLLAQLISKGSEGILSSLAPFYSNSRSIYLSAAHISRINPLSKNACFSDYLRLSAATRSRSHSPSEPLRKSNPYEREAELSWAPSFP